VAGFFAIRFFVTFFFATFVAGIDYLLLIFSGGLAPPIILAKQHPKYLPIPYLTTN